MNEPREKVRASLAIVMPVYNEQDVIATVIADYVRIADCFESAEIIAVNDASKDGTLDTLDRIAAHEPRVRVISNEQNLGHGPTLVKAYRAATGEYVFHVDSDNQFIAEDFWLLWDMLEKNGMDVAIGTRTKRHDPFARLLLTRCLKLALFLLYGIWLQDANSPFRLYRGQALQKLLLCIEPSARLPSICLAVAAYKKGYRVAWVGVQHLPRVSGRSFIRSFKIFSLTFTALGELLAFRRLLNR